MIPLKTFQDAYEWIELVVNKDDPFKSRYRCEYCHAYAEKVVSKNQSSNMAKKGVLYLDYKKNFDKIKLHSMKSGHQKVLIYININKNVFKSIDVSKSMSEQSNDLQTRITAKVMRSISMNVKHHGSYEQMSDILFQKLNFCQGEIGYHHASRGEAYPMVEVISETMHSDFLKKLRHQRILPFYLIHLKICLKHIKC